MIYLKSTIFLGFSGLVMVAGSMLNKKMLASKSQGSPFECGINTLEFSEIPMSMRFFMLTVVFLIFDVELVLLFPFLIYLFQGMSFSSGLIFILFLSLLVLGIFVEWNQNLLEWV